MSLKLGTGKSSGRGLRSCLILAREGGKMELLEIRSAHDLTAHAPETRRAGAHSYLVSCRQFMSVLGQWQKAKAKATAGSSTGTGSTVSFMTMSADQIWITESEIDTIVSAIHAARSPVSLP